MYSETFEENDQPLPFFLLYHLITTLYCYIYIFLSLYFSLFELGLESRKKIAKKFLKSCIWWTAVLHRNPFSQSRIRKLDFNFYSRFRVKGGHNSWEIPSFDHAFFGSMERGWKLHRGSFVAGGWIGSLGFVEINCYSREDFC